MKNKTKDIATCTSTVLHKELVDKAVATMPEEGCIHETADFFKVLGDAARLKIIHALATSEMCVCDLVAVLGMKQPAVSQHLRTLRDARLVKYRKDGKAVYYSLLDDHVKQIGELGLKHAMEKAGGDL